jgi:hypothetical protein
MLMLMLRLSPHTPATEDAQPHIFDYSHTRVNGTEK